MITPIKQHTMSIRFFFLSSLLAFVALVGVFFWACDRSAVRPWVAPTEHDTRIAPADSARSLPQRIAIQDTDFPTQG
jgi:type IV secretory pathway TrbF-like protein